MNHESSSRATYTYFGTNTTSSNSRSNDGQLTANNNKKLFCSFFLTGLGDIDVVDNNDYNEDDENDEVNNDDEDEVNDDENEEDDVNENDDDENEDENEDDEDDVDEDENADDDDEFAKMFGEMLSDVLKARKKLHMKFTVKSKRYVLKTSHEHDLTNPAAIEQALQQCRDHRCDELRTHSCVFLGLADADADVRELLAEVDPTERWHRCAHCRAGHAVYQKARARARARARYESKSKEKHAPAKTKPKNDEDKDEDDDDGDDKDDDDDDDDKDDKDDDDEGEEKTSKNDEDKDEDEDDDDDDDDDKGDDDDDDDKDDKDDDDEGEEKPSKTTPSARRTPQPATQKHANYLAGKARWAANGGFECPKCHKRFDYKSNLTRHDKSVHLKLREHVCKVCGRAFADAGHLQSHIRNKHNKIRIYGRE
jgi:hypothetical protein